MIIWQVIPAWDDFLGITLTWGPGQRGASLGNQKLSQPDGVGSQVMIWDPQIIQY